MAAIQMPHCSTCKGSGVDVAMLQIDNITFVSKGVCDTCNGTGQGSAPMPPMPPREDLLDICAKIHKMMPLRPEFAERVKSIAAHGSDEEVNKELSRLLKLFGTLLQR